MTSFTKHDKFEDFLNLITLNSNNVVTNQIAGKFEFKEKLKDLRLEENLSMKLGPDQLVTYNVHVHVYGLFALLTCTCIHEWAYLEKKTETIVAQLVQ